jgi:hypothetical protein
VVYRPVPLSVPVGLTIYLGIFPRPRTPQSNNFNYLELPDTLHTFLTPFSLRDFLLIYRNAVTAQSQARRPKQRAFGSYSSFWVV